MELRTTAMHLSCQAENYVSHGSSVPSSSQCQHIDKAFACRWGLGPMAQRKKQLIAEGKLDKHGRPNAGTPKEYLRALPDVGPAARGGRRGRRGRQRTGRGGMRRVHAVHVNMQR